MAREVLGSLSTALAADRIDPLLTAGILGWNARHIPWTDAWYDFPIFHPLTEALTFSEHLLGLSVVATPIYWLTGNAVITYNLTFLTTYVLCGAAMFALVWHLTGHGPASFLAGLAYAFAPYRTPQMGHIQMLAVFWAPLALLGLHAFLETRRRAWLVLFGVCWLLQAATNGYLLVFFSVLVACWVLWFAVFQQRWRELAMIGVAVSLSVLPLVPVLLRYVEAHERYDLGRPSAEVLAYSADITSVLCAGPRVVAWGWLGAGVCGGERDLFPGVAVLLLCAVAAWGARPARDTHRRPLLRLLRMASAALFVGALTMIGTAASVALTGPWRWNLGPLSLPSSSVVQPFSRGILLLLLAAACSPAIWRAVRRASIPGFYLVMAPVMWSFTWGPAPALFGTPALAQGPYAWLTLLPGIDGLRVPARFWMMTVLCLCVALGVLLAAALRRVRRPVALTVGVAAAVGLMLDGWSIVTAPGLVPSGPRPDLLRGGVALTLPLGAHDDRDTAAQFEAIEGGWASVNGHSGYEPRHYELLREASRQASSLILAPFLARGDLNVILYESWSEQDALVEGQPGAKLVGRGNGLRQYLIPRQGKLPPSAPSGSRHQIASISSSCVPMNAWSLVDGDRTTRWGCESQSPDQQVVADLGQLVAIGEVVPALGEAWTEYPRHLIAETSRDGIIWDDAWNGAVLAETFEALVRDPKQTRVVLAFSPRRARYVRLRLAAANEKPWSMAELEIWSGAATPNGDLSERPER